MKNSMVTDLANRERTIIWRLNRYVTRKLGAIVFVVNLCKRLALTLTVLAGSVSAASAASGVRTFGGWVVGCDNTNSCRAIGLQEGATRYVVLDLAGGPDATPTLRFVGVGDESASEGGALSVDGGVAFALPASIDENRTRTFSIDRKNLVYIALDEMRKGRGLHFGVAAGHVFDNGSPSSMYAVAYSVSLEGLDAALRFIDEVQGAYQHRHGLEPKGIQSCIRRAGRSRGSAARSGAFKIHRAARLGHAPAGSGRSIQEGKSRVRAGA